MKSSREPVQLIGLSVFMLLWTILVRNVRVLSCLVLDALFLRDTAPNLNIYPNECRQEALWGRKDHGAVYNEFILS